MSETIDEAVVLFDELAAAGGKLIGVATLNMPKTLNGISLEMANLLEAKFTAWAQNDGIAIVMLQGAGEKAFCAGGDLHGLYKGMREYQASGSKDIRTNAHASKFFGTEYRLDYLIHTYSKPILCWGHGIVMGGGIGLMAGASHRVVSERSKLAFPEITIGLYPDVGGSWLLHRVPDNAGLFLALTGAPLNAGDAIYAGLADHCVTEEKRGDVLKQMRETDWSNDADDNRHQLTALLQSFAYPAAAGPLQQHAALIASLCANENLETVVADIQALTLDDAWLQNAKASLTAGSPGSARLGFELQHRAASLSLADTFRMEYTASLQCAAHGDFAEGIRALLIDKDREPHWNPATLAEASAAWAASFFTAPWSANEHPLADLDKSNRETVA